MMITNRTGSTPFHGERCLRERHRRALRVAAAGAGWRDPARLERRPCQAPRWATRCSALRDTAARRLGAAQWRLWSALHIRPPRLLPRTGARQPRASSLARRDEPGAGAVAVLGYIQSIDEWRADAPGSVPGDGVGCAAMGPGHALGGMGPVFAVRFGKCLGGCSRTPTARSQSRSCSRGPSKAPMPSQSVTATSVSQRSREVSALPTSSTSARGAADRDRSEPRRRRPDMPLFSLASASVPHACAGLRVRTPFAWSPWIGVDAADVRVGGAW
jgi:hypothetical protein